MQILTSRSITSPTPRWARVPLLLATLCALTACEPKAREKDASEADKTQTSNVTTTSAAPEADDPRAKLRLAFDAVIDNCTITIDNVPKKCAGGELKELVALLKKEQLTLYPEVVILLGNDKLEVRRVAAYALDRHMYYWLAGTKKHGGPDREATTRLIRTVERFNPRVDRLAASTIRFTMDAATLAGMNDEARALLAKFNPDTSKFHRWIYAQGLRRTMVYGRMEFFELIQKEASSEHDAVRLAAFEAPNQMSEWKPAEDEAICKWAAGFIKDEDGKTNGGPAQLMLRCKDVTTYRNILLDEATRRLNAGTYKRPFAFAMSRICEAPVYGRTPAAGASVCKRGEILLQRVITNDKVLPRERAYAVGALANQFTNEDTIAFLEKHKGINSPAVARRIDKELKNLTASTRTKSAVDAVKKEEADKKTAPPREGDAVKKE